MIGGVVRKLRGRSLAELRVRGAQWAAAWRERQGWSPDARTLGDADLARRLAPGVPADAAALHARFVERAAPRFFAGADDAAGTVAALRARWPERERAIVRAAERAMAGEFDFFGHRALSYGTPIDWHLDPLTGRRAALDHWSRVPYLDATVVGDHKVVWEVNRHQFLVTVAQAYLCTGDERWARAVVDTIATWIDANPPKRGINWASSLEVGFRAMSWLWALRLVRHSPALDAPRFRRVLASLYLHARHLETFLSTYFSPNTHLTGEALALFHLGVLLPDLRDAARWRDLGWGVLLEQLGRQIHGDGVYFEQATYYQKYTVDFYLHAFALAGRNGITVPEAARATVERAVDHLRAAMRPDGLLPLFGDDDGGRLTRLTADDERDVRPTLAVAALTFARADLAAAADGHAEEALWLFGHDAPDRLGALRAAAPSDAGLASAAFSEGGYFVMRDGAGSDASWLMIDCGPHGTMNAGHAHADVLSFELALRGRPLVVDGGTYVYVGAERDTFRGASAHNAPIVDGQGSSAPSPGRSFAWATQAKPELRGWLSTPELDWFRGAHDGFLRLPDPVRCERSLLAVHGAWWLIRDTLAAAGAHAIELPIHLAPGLTATVANGAIDVAGPDGAVARLVAFARDGRAPRLEVETGRVSAGYGRVEPTAICRLRVDAPAGCDVATLVLPAAADGTLPTARAEASADQWRLVIDRGTVGVDAVVLAGSGDGVCTSGGVGLVQRDRTGTATRFALVGAGQFVQEGRAPVEAGGGECAIGTLLDSSWRVARHAFTYGYQGDVRD